VRAGSMGSILQEGYLIWLMGDCPSMVARAFGKILADLPVRML
jgi:hypothetical protein